MASVTALKMGAASCCERPSDLPMLSLVGERFAKVRRVRRGRAIYSTLDPADTIYYLKKGSVKLLRCSQAGEEVIIDRYDAGSFLGNLCFCGWPAHGEGFEREVAVALDDAEIILTSAESLKRNIKRYPEALLTLLGDYCRRLAAARGRIEGFVLHEASERLARTLLLITAGQNGDHSKAILDAAVTHEELAQWIGVTRPFVTRLMRQLRGRGFVEPLAPGKLLIHRDKIATAYSKAFNPARSRYRAKES